MGVTAAVGGKLALAEGVVDAWVLAEIVRELAFSTHRAVIFVVKLLACLFRGLGLHDLASDRVGEQAVEAIFAVSLIKVDARIVAAINVGFGALTILALVHCEVLLGAICADHVELAF